MKSRITRLTYCLPLLSLAAAMPAYAQDAADDESRNDEIVVTAQFREQNLQDTPLAITAVNAEMMEAKNQTDIGQVADTAPNVTLRQQGTSWGPSINAFIRGVGQYDFSPAYEPGVGIYIDDVYYPSLTGAMFDLLDLERVEILRGPQGTLAGRNSIGGAIKLFSSRPDGSTGGFAEATYGSRNKIGFRGSAEFPLADGLSARISGVYKSQDGYVDVLDFGCANPPGSALNDGTSDQLASGTFPIIEPLTSNANCKVGSMGDVNYGAVRGMLRYQSPDDKLDILVSADYTRDSRTNAAEVLLDTVAIETPNMTIPLDDRFICGKYCNYQSYYLPGGNFVKTFGPWDSNGFPLMEMRGQNRTFYAGYNFAANISYKIADNISLESITGYGSYDSAWDATGDLSPATRGGNTNELHHWHWSQELRLNIEPVDTVNVVLGGYYFKQNTAYPAEIFGRTFGGYPIEFFQDDSVDADSKAAFANLSWEIVPDLNLNAGIRYTEESKVYNYGRYDRDGQIDRFVDPVGYLCGYGFSGVDTNDCNGNGNTTEELRALTGNPALYNGNKVDWRVALDYRFSPEFLVYASAATGFKGGGTNPRPFNAYQAVGFGPEELISYELGFKSDLLDRRLRLNVAAFIADYTDIQTSVAICPLVDGAPAGTPTVPCAARVNAGDARYKGLEVEMNAEPVDDFNIDASLTVLDFKYKSLSESVTGVYLDDKATNAPEFKANIGAQYRADLGGSGSITPRVDVDYTGSIYTGRTWTDPADGTLYKTTIPKTTLVNASITWRNADDDLSIALRARNLFDKYYFASMFDLRTQSQYWSGTVGSPREISLVVKKDF